MQAVQNSNNDEYRVDLNIRLHCRDCARTDGKVNLVEETADGDMLVFVSLTLVSVPTVAWSWEIELSTLDQNVGYMLIY